MWPFEKRKWFCVIWSYSEHGATFTDYVKASNPEKAWKKIRRKNSAIPGPVVRKIFEYEVTT